MTDKTYMLDHLTDTQPELVAAQLHRFEEVTSHFRKRGESTMPRPLADFHADVLQWLLSGQTQCEMQKEGLDRFHESIMQEVNDGRLLLGVKRMVGVSPASVAHSKVLLYSPWIVAAGCVALPWNLTPDWFAVKWFPVKPTAAPSPQRSDSGFGDRCPAVGSAQALGQPR